MNTNEFYQQLSKLPTSYSWDISTNQTIIGTGKRGKAKGLTFNPITAVAFANGFGTYLTNKRETMTAGRTLGLPKTFTENVYQATTNYSNRGHSQVVRGKIRSVLEV